MSKIFQKLLDRLTQSEQPESKLKPGTVFRDKLKDGSQGPEMVVIPAGMFRMGHVSGYVEEWALPVHSVQFYRPFAIGRYAVTFEEYDLFATATGRELPSDENWGRGRRPVIMVSWNDAVEYAKCLSAQTGKHYRLPTESEWEFAARSGGKEERWAGTSSQQELGEYAWYKANSGSKTQPVGGKKSNGLGLYDMSGNVCEWVQTKDDLLLGGGRVGRGGSWYDVSMEVFGRLYTNGSSRHNFIGFRLAQDID